MIRVLNVIGGKEMGKIWFLLIRGDIFLFCDGVMWGMGYCKVRIFGFSFECFCFFLF